MADFNGSNGDRAFKARAVMLVGAVAWASAAGGGALAQQVIHGKPARGSTASSHVPSDARRTGGTTEGARDTAELNRRTAEEAAALTDATRAADAARRKAEEDSVAAKLKYEADMAAYRQKLAADKAEADRVAAEYAAKMANYRACVAGDKAACARDAASR